MRLDKYIRRNILEAAKKAIRSPDPKFSIDTAVAMFEDWHGAWMSPAVREAWGNSEVREQMNTQDCYVDFGPLVRHRAYANEGVPSVKYLCSFEDVFEAIIDQLDEGKKVREKQWRDNRCPQHVKEWLIAYYAFKAQRDKAISEVETALASCTTTDTLVKKFPTLQPYVPTKTPNLPALPTGLRTFESLTKE